MTGGIRNNLRATGKELNDVRKMISLFGRENYRETESDPWRQQRPPDLIE